MNAFFTQLQNIQNKLPVQLAQLQSIISERNNWVVPGHVMAGPFPGHDGMNYVTEQDAVDNLSHILRDGIDAFICLCAELPHQNDAEKLVLHPYFPVYKSYAQIIKEHALAPGGKDVIFDYAPCVDQSTPSQTELVVLLTRIMELLNSGRKVFIHCAGGHGRTGLIVACLMMCLYVDVDVEYSLFFTQYCHNIRRAHDERCKHFIIPVRSPNSHEQFAMVREFAAFLEFSRKLFPIQGPISHPLV